MAISTVSRTAAGLIGLAFLAAACSGGDGPDPNTARAGPPTSAAIIAPPKPPPTGQRLITTTPTTIQTKEQAAAFLMRATFGGTPDEVAALVGKDAAQWLKAEFEKPATLYLPDIIATLDAGGDPDDRAYRYAFWDAAMAGDDQLRQRVVFALSQILVASDVPMGNRPERMAHYMDALSSNAFGTYREVLQDVTYTPAMAEYLTYMRNRKADTRSGRMPDENYAREVMQLFTIGIEPLNRDGTPKKGAPDTYTNDDIEGLARVFTGLAYKANSFYGNGRAADAEYAPLQMFSDQHSPEEKTFLGLTIPAGTDGNQSVSMALDHLFWHPNTGPFISRQLIQRFTASHPEPAYVERVTRAFETGAFVAQDGTRFGSGNRGDMKAVMAAILLDDSLFEQTIWQTAERGKIREPVLLFTHYVRAFGTANINSSNEHWLADTSDPLGRLGQQPFRSPSVFNFYRPGYILPGSETGDKALNAPEFQIVNETSAVGYVNFMTTFIQNRSPRRTSDPSFDPDYSEAMAVAHDPAMLVDHADLLLTAGRLPDGERAQIMEAVSKMPLRTDKDQADRLKRVELAIAMLIASPAYAIVQ